MNTFQVFFFFVAPFLPSSFELWMATNCEYLTRLPNNYVYEKVIGSEKLNWTKTDWRYAIFRKNVNFLSQFDCNFNREKKNGKQQLCDKNLTILFSAWPAFNKRLLFHLEQQPKKKKTSDRQTVCTFDFGVLLFTKRRRMDVVSRSKVKCRNTQIYVYTIDNINWMQPVYTVLCSVFSVPKAWHNTSTYAYSRGSEMGKTKREKKQKRKTTLSQTELSSKNTERSYCC